MIDKIIDLVKINPLKAVLFLFIMIALIIFNLVKKESTNKYIQNLFKNIFNGKKDNVFMVIFSKMEAVVDDIIEKYPKRKTIKLIKDYTEGFKKGYISQKEILDIMCNRREIIKDAKSKMKKTNSMIYMGFPHVPLAFYDGYIFEDANDVILYDYNNGNLQYMDKGFFELKSNGESSSNIFSNINDVKIKDKEVILKIEQSFDISDEPIKKLLGDLDIVTLKNNEIRRWGITSYSQITLFQKELEKILRTLNINGVKKVHVFATTPVSLGFSLGRIIKHYHPDIVVYNFCNDSYDWCINLKKHEVSILS